HRVPGFGGEGGGVVVGAVGYEGVEQKTKKMGGYRLAGIKVNSKFLDVGGGGKTGVNVWHIYKIGPCG
nr:hypothetical protein [Tanacetum cinerariifolium]